MKTKLLPKVLTTFWYCFLLLLAGAYCRSMERRSIILVCQEPSSQTLQNMYDDWLSVKPHESFNLLPQMEPHVLSLVHDDREAERETNIAGVDTQCDAFNFGEVYQRSTCPFHFVSLENPHRYPRKLVSAKCNYCEHCAGLDSSEYGCFPIPYYAKVLVRGDCQNGIYQYTQAYEQLAAGCGCARKSTGSSLVD